MQTPRAVGSHLMMGPDPPATQMACLPSGAKAMTDRADMAAVASGVVGPSLMIRISSGRRAESEMTFISTGGG